MIGCQHTEKLETKKFQYILNGLWKFFLTYSLIIKSKRIEEVLYSTLKLLKRFRYHYGIFFVENIKKFFTHLTKEFLALYLGLILIFLILTITPWSRQWFPPEKKIINTNRKQSVYTLKCLFGNKNDTQFNKDLYYEIRNYKIFFKFGAWKRRTRKSFVI